MSVNAAAILARAHAAQPVHDLERRLSHWTASETRFGIYFHWPFCAAKCPYCDFNSHVRHAPVDQEAFADAMIAELATQASWLDGTPVVDSIFFGGGTPSLMSGRTVHRLLDAVDARFKCAPDIEITLEANPTSVEAQRFADYRSAGVNRVSVGVQALNDPDLRALGRLHSVSEALAAVDVAARTFERFSFDLIYARPGQSLDAWGAELGQALQYSPRHVSLYQLTIEPGTPFHALHAAGKLAVPDAAVASDLFELTQEMCGAANLAAYEVSNHAAPSAQSRHNLVYWRSGQFLGVGPGAHGRLIHAGTDYATSTIKSPEVWQAAVLGRAGAPVKPEPTRHTGAQLLSEPGHGLIEAAALTSSQIADEMLVMGLRLAEGINLAELARRTGVAFDHQGLNELVNDGLIDGNGLLIGQIIPTSAGRRVTNALAVAISRAFVFKSAAR